MKSVFGGVLAIFSLLLIFSISGYIATMIYYFVVRPDLPQDALGKGELYVRGIIHSKEAEIVALEIKNCSADDCHMLFNKEVLIRKSEFDTPYQSGEEVIVHLDRLETLPEYRKSEIQDGLLNKQIFTIRSMEKNRFDFQTVDRGKISSLGILAGACLSTALFYWYSHRPLLV